MSSCKEKLALFIFAILLNITCFAQAYVVTGGQLCLTRTSYLQGVSSIFGGHLASGVTLHLKKAEKNSFSFQSGFIQKGYDQQLGGYTFKTRFFYGFVQSTYNYELHRAITANIGFNYALLLFTNVKDGGEIYRHHDFGLVTGLNFFENKIIGFYVQAIIGLTPVLSYDNIDPQGNFKGKINDLESTCITFGLKWKLHDKKLSF